MEEVIFLVEESAEGGFTAKGLGVSIYTEAESLEELRIAVKDAVNCHFEDDKKRLIRLHIVKDEVYSCMKIPRDIECYTSDKKFSKFMVIL